jgi:hypothetical protein
MSIFNHEKKWVEKYKQRQDESILQFINNISPKSASESICL